ncbi:hypothetical protein HJC23_008872 [Cyclotella cryptica]|uniref:Peroxin-5 n=1 Tax=Cyclotella cryptica TaxID=29204 RepID=A0ABD3PB82_9STRA|eukprot:CCRYP_015963-RA/>CCRYP_015963-RA protein AED:0.14 eAED:0.14 QI:0/-1/0/1/-1/1/1/0/646
MADCSATGTALDRVLHSALQQQQQQGHPNGIAAAASHHAVSAFGSLLGSTASTALAGPTSLVMPAAPMETLLHSSSPMGNFSVDVREASSFARPSSSLVANPHHGYHRHPHSSLHSSPLHIMSPPQPQALHHHPMMMMQQQYQMMQQMQMQQMHMAAMVEHQRTMQQRQQQQQQPPTTMSGRQTRHAVPSDQMQIGTHSVAIPQTSAIGTVSSSSPQEEENDVLTVGDGELDEIYNEGNTDPASIERLARAWREAEEEFAAELDEDDEYDVSNMGGVYDHLHDTTTGDASRAPSSIALDPPYQFSPLSQTYGCIQTPSTDLPPTQLTYPDNLYERGLQHFHSGQLSTAILCFESTLRNVDAEHADAWRMLGKCHTENDDDSKAIICYCKSLERDPYSPETLLALVVAYVNELDWERAVETLRLWVAHHPLYAGMEGGMAGVKEEEEDLYGNGLMEEEGAGLDEEGVGGGGGGIRRMRRSTLAEMRDVERLLLRALNYNHDDDAAADVYEALGVVYNVSRDYDAAVDAFRRAIAVRPDDYQLRNKVGATLANSNRSEEALPEYRIALKLKPKYARGWLNMAISHSNLRNYSQAARCYLQTLSLNPEARHVWSYLRIALTCDEKWDLLPLAASQNLSAFHEHFDFVEY